MAAMTIVMIALLVMLGDGHHGFSADARGAHVQAAQRQSPDSGMDHEGGKH